MTAASGLPYYTERALLAAVRARLLVLDVDGVLLDPRPSFYRAAIETASWALAKVVTARVEGAPIDERLVGAFKSVGGWNDDFDLSCGLAWAAAVQALGRGDAHAVALQCGGGLEKAQDVVANHIGGSAFAAVLRALPVQVIRSRTAARYAGRRRCGELYGFDPGHYPDLPDDGLYDLEPLLCTPALLQRPAWHLALFTGRNAGEAQLAVERVSIDVEPARRKVDDGSRPRKPAPDGLLELSSSGEGMVFIGDSVDDQRAATAYRTARPDGPPLTFVRVLGDGASSTDVAAARALGADLVVRGLDDFLHLAREARQA